MNKEFKEEELHKISLKAFYINSFIQDIAMFSIAILGVIMNESYFSSILLVILIFA